MILDSKEKHNRFKELISRALKSIKKLPEAQLLLILAFVVGCGSGAAAVVLKKLIELIGNGLTGWFNTSADSFLFLLYPGVGMLISLIFVKYAIKDDISHGVTKALLAVSKNKSRIKGHNTWSSILASSVTIGFGGSVGAEAPIVYTGAAIGSNIARVMGLSYRQMTILLGCGAAGAIAGIFKAPMAGILFTLEILLFNISMSSILPLLVSSVTATAISYFFLGRDVAFASTIDSFVMGNIPYYLILGIFCGFVSLYFTRTTLAVEDKVKKIANPYTRWLICALLLGILIFVFPPLYGEGYKALGSLLTGNPLEGIDDNIFGSLLGNKWFVPIFFAAVLVFKVFTMSLTNAGGGVGGTFGPTLIVGGFAGFVMARCINLTGFHALPEANFVLVGMAGLMAGVMQAPMTAIFLIAEITGGYELLMPLIITSAISFATIRIFEPYSIYTKRIAKSGELLTHDSDQAVLTLLKTSELIESDFTPVQLEDSLGNLVKAVAKSKRNIFPVLDSESHFQGIIFLDDIREIMFDRALYDAIYVYNIMKDAPALVFSDEKMDAVMQKFEESDAWNLPVVDSDRKYLGFVSKSKIFSSYREQLQQVSHD